MDRLTAQELTQYENDGYVMVPDVFDESDLEPVRRELTEVIHQATTKYCAENRLSRTYEEESFETRLTRIFRECPEIMSAVTGRAGGGHSGPAFYEFIISRPIISRIESIIGPEIIGSSVYRIRPKVPSWDQGVVPWHQDSGYFNPACDDELIVTCWIPLVDTNAENGCLRVLPGAHKNGVTRHFRDSHGGYLEIVENDLPPIEPVVVPVPKGGVLFMTNRTPHMSTEHDVDIVRWAIDVRYQSATLPNNVGQTPEGFDVSAPDEEIACYPPEADFIVQSHANPDSETAWDEFNAMRQRYETRRPDYHRIRWASRNEFVGSHGASMDGD
mgnify:CR=1 FL=1